MSWKVILVMALGFARAAGEAKKAEDANTTGKDDAIGVSIVYACDLLEALLNNKPLPVTPKEVIVTKK